MNAFNIVSATRLVPTTIKQHIIMCQQRDKDFNLRVATFSEIFRYSGKFRANVINK
jgi:hypothetical protein